MDGNPISGKIPDFIGNWTQLNRLDMQGTSLEGPFPPSFANLSSVTELRVSDMRGITDFPPLQNMKKMHHLVLRNLLISDRIHEYIGGFSNLKSLDLTFNNLSGNIPISLSLLPKDSYMKKIGDIPKERRPRLLSVVKSRLISRMWEIAGTRYEDVKLAKKCASVLLSLTDDSLITEELWACRISKDRFFFLWLNY